VFDSDLCNSAKRHKTIRGERCKKTSGGAADNVVEARLEEVNFTGPISQLVARPLADPAVTLSVKRQSRAAGQPVEPGVTVRLGWSASEGRLVSE